MKLHLPTRLRKAVVASLVAVASLATTLSTTTLFAAGAVLSLSSVASAAVEGPGTYNETQVLDSASVAQGGTVYLIPEADTVFDITAQKFLNVYIQGAGHDVKLVGKQDSNNYDYILVNAESSSLWLAQGSFRVQADADLASAGTIYLGGGQMQFVGAVNLSNDFVIGESISTTEPPVLGQTAFRVGHTEHTGTKTTLTGTITVQEDAAISYQNNNSLQLNGTLTGSGALTLQAYNNSSSSLILYCDTSNYTGAVKSTYNTLSLKLAKEAVQLGGLDGSFSVGLDTATSSVLTLNVADGASYSYTGTLANNISVVKEGAGAQAFRELSGNVLVNEGTLQLDTMSGLTGVTVKSGATLLLSGVSISSTSTTYAHTSYRTASAASVDMSLITAEAGANIRVSDDKTIRANSDYLVYVDKSCWNEDGGLTIKSGKILVADPQNGANVSESIAQASKIVLDGGTLFSIANGWDNSITEVNLVVDADIEIKHGNGGGTFAAAGDATTSLVDRTTYTGALTGNGWLFKTDGGYVVYAGDVSGYTGKFNVQGGTLEISSDISGFNGSDFQIDAGKVLRLSAQSTSTGKGFSGGGTLEIVGKLTMTGNPLKVSTHILENGFLQLSRDGDDALNYGSGQTITIDNNAELNVGNHRQTVGKLNFVLNGGRISGVGSNICGLDFNDAAQGGSTTLITVNEDSDIDTPIRFHNTRNVNALIAEDKSLTFSKRLFNGNSAGAILSIKPLTDGGNGGSLVLSGAGELDVSNVAMDANTKLVFDSDMSLTHEAAITGQATSEIVKKGASAITLSGVSNFAGSVRISEGSVAFTQAATLGKLLTDGGSLMVDAAAPPAVLTLGASEGIISLVVKNAASIADGGVDVFGGSSIPTNANVVVDSVISESEGTQYVATYANGKLTKTALTDNPTSGDLSWKIDGVSNNWGLTTGANWDKAGTAQRWVNDSNVTFADASGESISVVSPVTAASATVSQGTDWEWVLGADKLTITNGVTIDENAALTITGLTSTNYQGVVTGSGTLSLKLTGVLSFEGLSQVISSASGEKIDTLIIGENSALQITSSTTQPTQFNNIDNIVVADGGRFDDRVTGTINSSEGQQITISGNGNNLTGPKAALTFAYEATQGNKCTFARKVILADDATIWVRSGATSELTGGLNANAHALTVAGGGVLKLKDETDAETGVVLGDTANVSVVDASEFYLHLRGESINALSLANGAKFTYYRFGSVADPIAAGKTLAIQKLIVGDGSASDVVTLKGTNQAGRITIGELAGAGTLNLLYNHGTEVVYNTIVSGSANFSGTVNLQSENSGSYVRPGVLSSTDTDALSKATICIASMQDKGRLGFALAGDKIQIAGINTASGIDGARAFVVSHAATTNIAKDGDNHITSDNTVRTLEIVGSEDNTFSGTVLKNVSLLMNGSGTQSFDGNLDAFNGSIAVQKGTLNLAKVANTTGITLAGAGATLGVTDGVSGKNLTAMAVGAVLNADLTLNGGTVELGSTATAWKATGGLSLGNHALALDSANKAQLTMLLDTGLEAGSVVELFTNVSALNDAAGNALSLAPTAKVSDYFSTATGSALENYLLSWSGDKLSLIMKDEIKDLEWNDDATGADANTWQSSAGLTNWTNTRTDTADFFSISDNVTFGGSGETVTVVGTVKPNDVTVETGAYTWDGDGSVEAAGTLVLGDDDGSSSGNLVISNTGSKSFAGGVKMYNESYLQVTDLTGWSGTVSGVGTFELANVGDVGALAQYVAADATEQLDKFALSGAGTTMTLADAAAAQLLNKVDYLQVADGAELKVTADVSLDTGKQVEAYGGSIDVAADKTATVADLLYTYGRLTKTGDGMLVLAGHANTVGNTTNADTADDNGQTVIAAGTLKIDDNPPADQPSYYPTTYSLGDVSGTGTLLLSDGEVAANNIADTVTVKVATEAAGDIVSLSGIAGSDLASINLAEGTQLAGAMGDITVGGSSDTAEMTLALSDVNVGSSATIETGKQAMIDQTDAAKLIINEGATVKVGIDAVVATLTAASTNEEDVYLHLTTGTLEYVGDVKLDYTEANVSKELMDRCGVKESGIEGGSIKLTGGADGIYVSSVDGNVVTSDKVLSTKQSTVVSKDDTLTLQLDGSAMTDPARINNLLGGTGSTLSIENSSPDMLARVELRNKLQRIDNPDPAEAVGADTYMAGDIDGTAGAGDVEIIISGPGTLTVGGDLTAAMLTMQEGGLTLEGENNAVNFIGDYVPDPTAAQPELTVNGKLTVTEASALYGTAISGSGTLALENDLLLQDDATLDGVGVELVKTNFGTDGSLSLQEVQDAEVSALSGNGYLQGKDAKLTVIGQGGSFSGILTVIDSTAPGTNVLAIAQGGSQTLDRVTGSRDWDVENAGELTINITNPAVTSGTGTNKTLTLGSLTAKNGSVTTMVINSDAPGTYLDLQRMVLENGATIALDSTGLNEVDFGGSITLARTVDGVTLGDEVAVSLADCIAFKKVREAWLETDGKVLTLQTQYHDENQYAKMASSENAMAGATMLWSVNTGALPNGSPLKSVDEAVNALSKQGTSAAAAEGDRIMAAVAGSSTAILGSAFASDVERQLRAIRNRTTTMGVSQAAVNEYMPYYNAWINAEGDHHEVDADGMAPGYTRDSWGGTVGFDVDVTPSFTMGLAVTAMYGDVESEGPDRIDGDFDTQYLSMFARYTRNAWTHTFVATVGRADISVERTVNYGTGSYTAEGETEGMALGFMYEVGRVYALTESGDVCLQPVFNVSLRHSTVDGYEETACDAGVAVDDQTATTLTFGLGARMQAVIGTSLYNRSTILEARALAKFDAGDREGEADVRLLQGGQSSSVKSAELGAFGAEVGVGVTIPMGSDSGSVFVDGSVEIRSGYTNINGTVGYRINF